MTIPASNKNQHAVQPLKELLDSVLSRLSALEAQVGVAPPPPPHHHAVVPPISPRPTYIQVHDAPPFVQAYNDYIDSAVVPLEKACLALDGLQEVGPLIKDAWLGVRTILILASRSKKPSENVAAEVHPHLKPIQTALEALRKLRLDRKYDQHMKATLEMAGCLSWILIEPPPQTPVAFCKEAMASSEFWSNKIRKEYKGKDETQIAFCDALKKVGMDLITYITEYHKTGLTWNPKGVSLAEAAVVLESTPEEPHLPPTKTPPSPMARRRQSAIRGGVGGMASLMAELDKKRSAGDGSSAATGLKHVDKSQQTWRKEFRGEKKATVPAPPPAPAAATTKAHSHKKLRGLPICEYQDRGHKWVVEHQTKESTAGSPLQVEVTDPKQQVYIFNCEKMTVQVTGEKVKSIILDKCEHVAVVFGSCISACEVVNSKKIQLQTTGVCPTFAIDKTDGCVVYLSKETVNVTSFVTSQSSEMNVCYPDTGDELKELPIPEQFVHKFSGKQLTSEVSDLYH